VVYRCSQEVWARVALDAVAASGHGCALNVVRVDGKLELPTLGSQAGAWEPAKPDPFFRCCTTKAYGQFLGRDFNPLDLLLLLRTVRSCKITLIARQCVFARPDPVRSYRPFLLPAFIATIGVSDFLLSPLPSLLFRLVGKCAKKKLKN